MADKKYQAEYRYKIKLQYLNTANNTATDIKNECLKSLIIDHNYDVNCMPVLFANVKLDKALVDDMIKNMDSNLLIMNITKYDNTTDFKLEALCFREKFIYFFPDDVNKMDPADYNDETNATMKGDTYRELTIGLLCLKHVNNNKIKCELTAKKITMYNIVKYLTSHINNMVIEPFTYNEIFEQFNLKPQDSVNKALEYLNNYRVFYSSPYRYYQDFSFAYILSSSGRATERKDELYSSVVIQIRDIDEDDANNTGVITNKSTGTYELYVNYANTQVYDNTIMNKSRNKVLGITTSGSSSATLKNNASYSTTKIRSVRLNNDNIHMLDNMKYKDNTENFLVYFSKNDLDTELLTLNKRISIRNIDRYQEFNGEYLLYRKREIYLREDESFVLNSMINLKRIDK